MSPLFFSMKENVDFSLTFTGGFKLILNLSFKKNYWTENCPLSILKLFKVPPPYSLPETRLRSLDYKKQFSQFELLIDTLWIFINLYVIPIM